MRERVGRAWRWKWLGWVNDCDMGEGMRTWFAWVAVSLAAVLACQAASTAKPKLDAEKCEVVLSKASSDPAKVSLPEIMDALKGALRSKKDTFVYEALPAFQIACGRIDERRLPELVEIFRMIPPDDLQKPEFFMPLGQAWLRLMVPEKLEKRPKFPGVAEEVKFPKDFPTAQKAAVRRYLAVMAKFQKCTRRPWEKAGKSFLSHQAEYWQLVESMLDSGKGPFSERLLEYNWGGWCGTGSEIFTFPQMTALTMAFAMDGKWEEAAGAALSVQGVDVGGAMRVLRACVEDSQTVVLGGLASAEVDPGGFFYGQTSLLAMLLDSPGDSRVRGLMSVAVCASGYNQAQDFKALGMLAREEPEERYGMSGSPLFGGGGLSEARVRPLDKEEREKVKAFLCSRKVSELSISGAEELVSVLGDSEWPGAVSALRGLLDHPSASVAESAARQLKSAGITVQVPPKLGPVRCRLTVDGKPYAGKRVQWSISWNEMGTSGEVTSDAEGIVDVPRSHFIDKTAASIRAFGLHSMDLKEISDPWFGVKLPLPPANDQVIPVEVKTAPVRVRLPEVRPAAELEGKFIEVVVNARTWQERPSLGFHCVNGVNVPVARDFVLNLASGEYNIEARLPGATAWGGQFEGGRETEVTLPIVRASTVRYAFKMPEGWPDYAASPDFMHDGKPAPADHIAEQQVIQGVREGKYMLHFPSSDELRQRDEYWKELKAPDFKGTDVPVEVKADSPLEIDLGEIVLK